MIVRQGTGQDIMRDARAGTPGMALSRGKGPLVIIGAGEMALIAHEYFTHDSQYDVVAFCVERNYIENDILEGKPVIAYDELPIRFPPDTHAAFVAIPASDLNRLRRHFYENLKEKGYRFASYISSHAFVWRNAHIGENSFIFENNVIQPFVKIGNNCILWSGNHIGHRTVVEDHVFIASHAVISGYCRIGEGSYVGVNATFNDRVTVGAGAVVGSGALVVKDAEGGLIHIGQPAKPVPERKATDVVF